MNHSCINGLCIYIWLACNLQRATNSGATKRASQHHSTSAHKNAGEVQFRKDLFARIIIVYAHSTPMAKKFKWILLNNFVRLCLQSFNFIIFENTLYILLVLLGLLDLAARPRLDHLFRPFLRLDHVHQVHLCSKIWSKNRSFIGISLFFYSHWINLWF